MFLTVNHFQMFKPCRVNLAVVGNSALTRLQTCRCFLWFDMETFDDNNILTAIHVQIPVAAGVKSFDPNTLRPNNLYFPVIYSLHPRRVTDFRANLYSHNR